MKRAKFAMAFHCHQPVFNFDREIEYAYRNAYNPLLMTLEEFPEIRVSFHYSGNMLEWLERRHPEYLEKVKKLMRRNQIELIGGGCFEPVMALIPESDRREQLKMNEEIIARIFGVKSSGVWLAERVWEPGLADTLAAAGVKYTIVDDHHILRAGVNEDKIFKPCLTRGETGSIILFPSLTRLRYSIPFLSPKVTLDYFRESMRRRSDEVTCFFFADDAEKFGAWPYTYRWVYRKGWLRDFFLLLRKNASWLQTTTYSDILDAVLPEEVRDVPASSYSEMMEWSGGNFRNFLQKYPEADRMYRRMMSISDMISRMGPESAPAGGEMRLREARKELLKAQASCAYWHGVFGGFYLPHLRSGVYEHLIKAQNIIGMTQKKRDRRVRAIERNFIVSGCGDGTSGCVTAERARSASQHACSETVIENELINVFVKSFDGGCVSELDYKPLNVNLVNTISRVREDYHVKLERDYSARVKRARKTIMRGGVADVHDVLGVGERRLRRMLFYDDYQRGLFLTHIFRDKRPWKEMWRGHASHDGFLKGAYRSRTGSDGEVITHVLCRRDKAFMDNGRSFDLEVIKRITVGSGPAVMFSHKILKHSGGGLSLRYAVEFNFLVWDRMVISRARMMRTEHFSLKDRYSGICLDFFLDRKLTVFMYPVYTINETEAGLRKTFQGVAALIGGEYTPGSDSDSDDMKITIAIG